MKNNKKTKNFFKRWVFGSVELGQPNALKGGLNEFFVFVVLPLHFFFCVALQSCSSQHVLYTTIATMFLIQKKNKTG